ncbi:MAG: hypothetical protein ABIQ59_13140 [Nocardioidaceae bacterium]
MSGSSLTMTLLFQAFVLAGAVVLHVYAVRHLTADDVPSCLADRIAWTVRLRPLVLACAAASASAGVVLGLR